DVLAPGGRFSVITFHSIEDRLVKNFLNTGCVEEQEADPVYGTRQASPFVLMNKKPIEASAEEVKSNPRSRSARLRVGIKK
ncbi:MAG: rRNA ((1402)-N(4))-methyltransferase RsmH, partial [Bacteroidota bacterium]